MKTLGMLFCILLLSICIKSQPCVDSAKVVKPVLSETAAKTYASKLIEAEADHARSPSADTLIWLGRRSAYLGEYKAAIKIFTEGIAKYPKDARMYRHRGHRYITIRCFDDAIKDLKQAVELIEKPRSRPDEIEPDGLPNARNIPTSTLNTNIWYHLGLAQYLTGDFNGSTGSFMRCYNLASVPNRPDMRVAAAHWVYMGARRNGWHKSPQDLLDREIKDGLDIIENHDYYTLIKLYRGKLNAEDLLRQISGEANTLGNASLGYGLGNWYFYNGDHKKAMTIFRQITAGNQWASFGFIAAEAELRR